MALPKIAKCREKPIVQAHEVTAVVVDTIDYNSISQTVCSKLKHGKCVHGITGKTKVQGKSCEYSQPKFCKKFTKYDSRGCFGCKKDKCGLFHPILCQNSTRYKKCLNSKCTYQHLKGTMRKEPKNIQHFPPLSTHTPVHYTNEQNFWQTKHPHRRVAQPQIPPTMNQNKSETYYNSNVHPENDFLSPPPLPNRPPDLASLQMQVNSLESLMRKILEMSLQQQHFHPPHLLNYQQNPQNLQKC